MRILDLDVDWASEVVAFCEQQIPLNRLEDGPVAAALRADLTCDLAHLRYGLGAPLEAVRPWLARTAEAVCVVFESETSLRTPERGRQGLWCALVAGEQSLAERLAAVESDAGEPVPVHALREALGAGGPSAILDALGELLFAHHLYAQQPENRKRPERLLSLPGLALSVRAIDAGLISRDSLPPDDIYLPLGLLPAAR